MKRKILLGLAAICSGELYAQNYSGTIDDLNTVFNPPANIDTLICNHLNDSPDKTEYLSCVEGVEGARWMAEKHAKAVGSYLGCLDGYYQGINDGFNTTANPSQAEIDAARAKYSQLSFNTAISRATEKANREGDTASADQLIKLYRSVLNQKDSRGNQVYPNKTPIVPPNTFKGYDDGYETDILPSQQTGSISDMEGVGSSSEDRYIAYRIKAKQAQVGSQLCDLNQTLFLKRRNMPSLTLWDFFRAMRKYNFENYGWKNGSWAWDFYVNEERTADQYAKFKKIENYKKEVSEVVQDYKEVEVIVYENGVPKVKKNADGTDQMKDGKPVYETKIDKVPVGAPYIVKKQVPLSAQEIDNLKKQYETGFEEAYSRYFAKQYASMEYYKSGSIHYNSAKQTGAAIGSEVARYRAERDAYNVGYKAQSVKVYAEQAEKKYLSSFSKLLNIFETNSVYELNDARIFGQVNDGIFRGGESIGAAFDVSNLGEKVNNSNFSIFSSNTVPQRASYAFDVPALTSNSFSTPILANLTSSLLAGDRIDLSLSIENQAGALSVADTLSVKKNQSIDLHDYAEVRRISPSININDGVLEVEVSVANASGSPSNTVSQVFMETTVSGTVSKDLMPIDGNGTVKPVLRADNIDPYALINNKTISVTAYTKIGGRVVSKKTESFNVSGLNTADLINKYFTKLATKQTNNTGGETRQKRLQDLADTIEANIANDIAQKIKWHKTPVLAATSLRGIVDVYEKSKRDGEMNADGQYEFDELAISLSKRVVSLKAKGLFNDKKAKKAYLKEVSRLATPGKISLNPKDYK